MPLLNRVHMLFWWVTERIGLKQLLTRSATTLSLPVAIDVAKVAT